MTNAQKQNITGLQVVITTWFKIQQADTGLNEWKFVKYQS